MNGNGPVWLDADGSTDWDAYADQVEYLVGELIGEGLSLEQISQRTGLDYDRVVELKGMIGDATVAPNHNHRKGIGLAAPEAGGSPQARAP